MTTIVTGGFGFIGSNFVLSHLKANPDDEIIIIDNMSYASDVNNLSRVLNIDWRVRAFQVDIRDLKLMKGIYRTYEPDITFHFAAESHVDNSITGDDDFLSTNINGTHNILKCIREVPGKLVHVSTDEVFGSLNLSDPSFDETTPYNPRNPYSATKAASDHLVRSYVNTHKIEAIVTNCSNNYGPRQHREKFIPTVIRSIQQGKKIPVYGTGANVRDWIFVEDHCDALLTIAKNFKSGERYNIGGTKELNNLEMIMTILDLMGKNPYNLDDWVEFVPDRKGHDFRYSMNSDKMLREFGWSAKTDLYTGLEKTLKWYKGV